MKVCTKCGVEQPLGNFYKASETRDGFRGDCKGCFRARAKARYPLVREQAIERTRKWRLENPERFRESQRRRRSTPQGKLRQREYHLQRTFGLTVAQYEEMLEAQGGGCGICGRPPRNDISLHVDHDHATGRVRRLLCFPCNNLLGDANDDPTRLRAAADYLDDHDPVIAEMRQLVKARVRMLVG